MEYSEVLEHFKNNIHDNSDIEIILLKHGIYDFLLGRGGTLILSQQRTYTKLPKNCMRY